MKPKVLAAGNNKLAQDLVELIKDADAKTYQKRLTLAQNNISTKVCTS